MYEKSVSSFFSYINEILHDKCVVIVYIVYVLYMCNYIKHSSMQMSLRELSVNMWVGYMVFNYVQNYRNWQRIKLHVISKYVGGV